MPSACCVIYCKYVIYLYYHAPCGAFSEIKKSQKLIIYKTKENGSE